MALYDKLFEPLQVGGVTIPNRVVRSPHGTGLVGEELIAYHEARARGGVGMSTLEASGVHPSAPIGVPVHSDKCIPLYEKLCARVAPHGMKLLQQIYHGGAGFPEAMGMPEHWSASAIPNPLAGVMPLEMTKTMIDDVVAGFASAARRCRDGGLDGVDIHASSGYLIHEFLSPATNHRSDDYGGSLENRLRFLLEVISAVRAEVGGGNFAVGVRLPNEDYIPGGLTAADNAEIAAAIDPLVDYISLHMGAYWRFHKLIGLMDEPLGLEMPANQEITPQISKPVMVVGRIMTLDHASHLVESGAADMVSMVRALIADPELVNKARRREEHKIRPCIGSNMGCVGGLMGKGRMGCVVNSTAGRESVLSFEPQHQASNPRKILVVGGGPAGLEFARTAALRGHRVELHEATKQLGGQVAMAATAPHRADLGAITSWLADELDSLEVDIHLNSLVDSATVADVAPDEIVIATGTTPRADGFQVATPAAAIPGFDLPHVHSSWDLFGHGAPVNVQGPAVVFDDTGSFEAISVADELLKTGTQVTMVSRLDMLGATVPYPPVTVGAARERLMGGNFEFIGGHYLREITADTVHIGVLFTERDRAIPARTVILVSHNQPNRGLAEELIAQGLSVHLVGDVRGRNSLLSAIHGAAELGRSL
jgi:2,4-dienoyl-CoA reductase-like NADH-dependent reductase (Old Yellow Enzyme family)/thioredoxin reductase